MHARLPDQEEMEEAINVLLSHMEQQEKRGFQVKDLHSILSKLPMPTPAPGRTFTVDQAIDADHVG